MTDNLWKFNKTQGLSAEIAVTELEQQTYNRDFGGVKKGDIGPILKPKNTEQLQQIIEWAAQSQLQLTPRCFGLSQSGQALAPTDAAILDLTAFDQIGEINLQQQTITAGPAVRWADVIKQTSIYHLIPKVQPFNVDLSIGGVLAAGGIGASSPFYGACSAHIDALQLVTANADIILCDQKNNSELFNAAMSNLNRHSVITQSTINLRHFKAKTRTFFLLYDNHETWLQDQLLLATQGIGDYIEAFCTASAQGMRNTPAGRKPFAMWLYALQLSIEYDEGNEPQLMALDLPLNYWRLLHIDDNNTLDFLHRHDARFAMMKQTGLWQQSHPWYEVFLDAHIAEQLLEDILADVPLSLGGICHLFPVAKKHLPEYFMAPDAENIVALTILPGGVVKEQLASVMPALEKINNKCLQAGGKRYLSGLLYTADKNFWQQHYGDRYQQWLAMKEKYDPQNVFTSVLFK